MRDLTPNEIGALMFKIRDDLETVAANLSTWRSQGIGPSNMVPISVIAAESKVRSTLTSIEDVIQLIAKLSI